MIASQQRFNRLPIHAATRFYCGGGGGSSSSATSTSVVDRRIGASDNARVLNISEGAVNFGGSGSGGGGQRGGPRAPQATTTTSTPESSSTQALTYTESGGMSVTGTGNTVTVTDDGAVQSALALARDNTAATVDANARLVDKVIASKSDKPAWYQDPLIIGGVVALGAIWFANRKK